MIRRKPSAIPARMRRAVALALALLLTGFGMQEEDPGRLVRSLEGADAQKAVRVVDRLCELGKPALEAVLSAARSPGKIDPFHLKMAEEGIRFRIAMGDRYHPPPRVTIRSEERTALDVLRDFKAQTGLPVDTDEFDQEDPGGKLKVDVENMPAFEALGRICAAGSLYIFREGNMMYLSTGGSPMIAYGSSDFLFLLEGYSLEESREFGGGSSATLSLQAMFMRHSSPDLLLEPEEITFTEVVDDTGKSLIKPPKKEEPGKPRENEKEMEAFLAASVGSGYPASAGLDAPAPDAKKISRLRGYLTMIYAGETEDAEFRAGKTDVPQTAGGYEIRLISMNPSNPWSSSATFELKAKEKGALPPDSLRMGIQIYCEDGSVNSADGDLTRQKDGSYTLSATFHDDTAWLVEEEEEKERKFSRIVIRIAKTCVSRRVYFDFQDVPWGKN